MNVQSLGRFCKVFSLETPYQFKAKKIIDKNKSAIKTVTEDNTTALVVETPTPLAPPEV